MRRRDVLAALAMGSLVAANPVPPVMSVEGYIFQQYAERNKKTLVEVVDEVFSAASYAGFSNVELSPAFFDPRIRDHVIHFLQARNLRMPSVYVGGPMHDEEGADHTIATALEIGKVCAPFGCKAIVNNPDPKSNGEPKTSAELSIQAESLNRMGRTLAEHGLELRVHHHTPQLIDNAREWRHILNNTEPNSVHVCVDCDWAYQAGFDPLVFISDVGDRLREIHIRSSKNKLWIEDLENSDIDYASIAHYLKSSNLRPLIVVELAYRKETIVTRSLAEDLRRSRIYAEKVFAVSSNA